MCLKKSKFKELMDDFPDARRFYYERAYKRRIEFRRRCLKQIARAKLKRGISLFAADDQMSKKESRSNSVSSHKSFMDSDDDDEKSEKDHDPFDDDEDEGSDD